MKTQFERDVIPDISMTTFVDFLLVSGTARLTTIRRAKNQYEESYSPAFDYYKPLRDRIALMHRQGEPVTVLDTFAQGVKKAEKRVKYEEYIAAYRKWLGRRQPAWTGTLMERWTRGDLSVRVNPELGLMINDEKHLIKLYFKPEPVSKPRAEAMLHLLRSGLSLQSDTIPALLDVPRGKLFRPTTPKASLDVLLAGEAAAFSTMWREV